MAHEAAAATGAGAEALSVRVVTPEGTLYKGEAGFVAAPGSDGELGILPSHTPLIAKLGTGLLRVTPADGTPQARFAVRGGFLQVVGDRVTLLATEAAAPSQVDAMALRAAHEEILKALSHPRSDEEYARLLEERRWIEARQGLVQAG